MAERKVKLYRPNPYLEIQKYTLSSMQMKLHKNSIY